MSLIWIACIVGGYLLGSIPFGVLIARGRGIDIRSQGSKNIGATNVGRVLGRKWGLLCFALDLSKSAVPVVISGLVSGLYAREPMESGTEWWLWMAVAMACLMGHMFSLFLRGGGGKGVATAFGSLLAMWPIMTIAALIAFIVWILTVLTTRMISLASVMAACVIPFAVIIQILIDSRLDEDRSLGEYVQQTSAPIVVSLALAALVIWKHRGNLARIRAGTESRIGRSGTDK